MSSSNSSNRLAWWSLAISAVALAISAIQPARDIISTINQVSVKITSPTPNQTLIGENYTVVGTAKDVPSDSDLWMVVRTEYDGDWYPVNRITINPDDSWTDDVDLGGDGPGSAGIYEIYVYLVGSQYTGALAADVKQIEKASYEHGVPNMPAGPLLLQSVVVKRVS